MLASVSVESEPITETLGRRPAWIGHKSIAVHYACTFAHLFTPRGSSDPPKHVFRKKPKTPCSPRELPKLKIGLGTVEL